MEDNVAESKFAEEYDASFSGEEKTANLMKLTSDAFTREIRTIKIKEIGFTDPVKEGRRYTMTGLTKTVQDLGVLAPIHVMTVPQESEDDDYKYILVDGLRRIYAALKNNQQEIDAVVWDFKDKDKGSDLALFLSLLLNRTQKRNWQEIWHLYQVLELQTAITPGTLEYLLQLESGDAMKLKDVMLCEYDEVKQALVNEEKDLDGAYKMLAKLRKDENQLEKDDVTGLSDTVEGAEDIGADKRQPLPQLSDQDVMELLDMADLDDVDEVTDEDFDEMNKSAFGDEQQRVGERHPLDPALRQAVLQRDDFTCSCCGMKMIGARLGLIAVHHILPVHTGGKDTLENLTTLCVNCHLTLHVMERNGGQILMSKDDFDSQTPEQQLSLKKALKLARVAIEADKRKGLSKEDVARETQDAIRHPMPNINKENEIAYKVAKANQNKDSEE